MKQFFRNVIYISVILSSFIICGRGEETDEKALVPGTDSRHAKIFDSGIQNSYSQYVNNLKSGTINYRKTPEKNPAKKKSEKTKVENVFGLPDDLVGESVDVKTRQLAKSVMQEGPNDTFSSYVGIKENGDPLLWRKDDDRKGKEFDKISTPRNGPPTPKPPPTKNPDSKSTTDDGNNGKHGKKTTPNSGSNTDSSGNKGGPDTSDTGTTEDTGGGGGGDGGGGGSGTGQGNTADDPMMFPHLMPQRPIPASTLYGNCGDPGLRSCFSYPAGCMEERSCLMAASIFKDDNDPTRVKVALMGTSPRGFIALGFSEDRFMGDDIVVHCNHISPGGSLMSLHLSYNDGYHSILQKDMENFGNTFTPIAGFGQSNAAIACEFDLNTTVALDNTTVIDMLGKQYHLMLAFGRYNSSGNIGHPEFGSLSYHNKAIISNDKINFSDMLDKPMNIPYRGRGLILLHIIPYILAFSFFIPSASIMAKYGREAYGRPVTSFGIPIWLLVHLSFQIIAGLLTILGLIGIISELDGQWKSDYSGYATFHGIIGIIATVVHWVNILIGGCGFSIRPKADRPQTDEKVTFTDTTTTTTIPPTASAISGATTIAPAEKEIRDENTAYYKFKWLHWYTGHFVYLSGMAVLLVAHHLQRSSVPCLFLYIVSLQVFVHFMTHIIMAFHSQYLYEILDEKDLKDRLCFGPLVPWTQKDRPEWENVQFENLEPWCGRRKAVIFYFITAGFCCAGLIGILFLPLVVCRQ